jgi:hypothetical protein
MNQEESPKWNGNIRGIVSNYKEVKVPKNVTIDVENSKTKKVISYKLPIIKYDGKETFTLDISNLNEEDKKIVELAIDTREEFKYTDIEVLFLEGSKYVRFGPDYNFSIEDNTLICEYDYERYKRKVQKNLERKEELKKVLENYKKNKKEN